MSKKTTPLFSDEQKSLYKERWLIPLHTLKSSLEAIKEQHSEDYLYKSPVKDLECFISRITFRVTYKSTEEFEEKAEFENILATASLAAGFSLHDEHFHITFYDFYNCEDFTLVEGISIVERVIWELEN